MIIGRPVVGPQGIPAAVREHPNSADGGMPLVERFRLDISLCF
jgi:hypothetical protein